MFIRLIVDAIPQRVWIGGPDANLEYCNQAWFGLAGLTLERSRRIAVPFASMVTTLQILPGMAR